MKPLVPILVVAITALTVASVQFAQRAAAERKRADAEVALRLKQAARIQQLERVQAGLEQQLMAARRAAIRGEGATARVPQRPAVAPPEAAFNGRPGPGFPVAFAGPRGALVRGPSQMSPAAQKFMQGQVRSNLRRMYQDVGRELNLSSEETNRLIDLVADQQTRQFGEHRDIPVDRPALEQMARDITQKNNAEIAALIGQGKLSQWQEYQKTLPERSQVDQLRQQLDGAGFPLSEDQRSSLLTALLEEKQRLPRPTAVPGATPEEMLAQQNEWQDEYDRNVQERARQVLSAEQYERYREYQDWMADMRKMVRPSVRFVAGPAAGATGNTAYATAESTTVLLDAPAPPPPPPGQ